MYSNKELDLKRTHTEAQSAQRTQSYGFNLWIPLYIGLFIIKWIGYYKKNFVFLCVLCETLCLCERYLK